MSVADELKKFKELLDSGVITQDEFDKKKKELLFDEKENTSKENIKVDTTQTNYTTSNTKSDNSVIIATIIVMIIIVLIAVGISGNSDKTNTTNTLESEVIMNDPNAIYLNYDTVSESEYCVKYNINGEEKLACKIPSGTYKLEVINHDPGILYDIFVEYDKTIKNSFGYNEQEPVLLIDLQEEQIEITDYSKYYETNNIADTVVTVYPKDNVSFEVTDELHLFLAMDTNIKLTKID